MSVLAAKALTIIALSMAPGEQVTIDGTIATSWDGTMFDAAVLFDAEAGGLAIQAHPVLGKVTMRATGEAGSACVAAQVASPCLVPRLPEIAHARMLTTEELRATLRGELAVAVVPRVAPPSHAARNFTMFSLFAAVLAMAAWLRSRSLASPLGRVSVAASSARKATAHDPTLRALRDEVGRLVDEARGVDRVRRAIEITLRRAREATHSEERAELEKLRTDLRAAEARLAEIAAALRLIPLRAREHRDLDTKLRRGAAMKSVTDELELRERALAEVE